MKFNIITQHSLHPFSSNYIEYLYPSDKLYSACVEIRDYQQIGFQKMNEIKKHSLSGPLSVLPNNNNGMKRKHAMLKKLDLSASHIADKKNNRLAWQGKNVTPSPKVRSLAPIIPGTGTTKAKTTSAAGALAVGIVLQTGRAKILYKIIKS